MASKKNTILVATDFTPVAECALQHALSLSALVKVGITLLHVIGSEKERAGAEKKLQAIVAKTSGDVDYFISVGNIFEDIGNVAKSLNAFIIFMGTHGVKGMQHVTGSYAVKVITNSSTPFIVVQNKGFGNGYRDILLPLDFTAESKHKAQMASKVASLFQSRIHLYYPKTTDEDLARKIQTNINYVKKQMVEGGIPFIITEAAGKGSFVDQVLKYAEQIRVDLIAIVNSQEPGFPEVMRGTDERKILSNEAQIPVLIVNPVKGATGALMGRILEGA